MPTIDFYAPDEVLAKELGLSLREMALVRRAWSGVVFAMAKDGELLSAAVAAVSANLRWPDQDKPLRTWDGSHFVPIGPE